MIKAVRLIWYFTMAQNGRVNLPIRLRLICIGLNC
ncbi:hypothetical protein [Caudoviricetes sp.]|nr:hypothetical protein [Caudoviricetes sp.]